MLNADELIQAAQVAAFVHLLICLMGYGMPLYGYYAVLSRLYNTGPEWIAWLAKPLGLCRFCFSFWAAAAGGLALGADPFEAVLFGAISVFLNKLTDRD